MPEPKVIAAAITGLIVYLITKLGVQADPVFEQAINVLAMLIAAWIAPAARPAASSSDDRLSSEAHALLNDTKP
jgi:hypothetical protein